jgi:hypothetical protein
LAGNTIGFLPPPPGSMPSTRNKATSSQTTTQDVSNADDWTDFLSSRSESSKDSSKGGEDTNSNSGPWVQFWNELFVIVMCSGTHLDKISCIVVTWLLLILLWHIKFNLYTIWCIVSGYVIFCMQL